MLDSVVFGLIWSIYPIDFIMHVFILMLEIYFESRLEGICFVMVKDV